MIAISSVSTGHPGPVTTRYKARVARAPARVHKRRIIPMSSPRRARVPSRRRHIRRDSRFLLRCFGNSARWVGRKLGAAPRAIRMVAIAATIVAAFSATNLIYHVVRKPTEMFSPSPARSAKHRHETWRQYAPLFCEYSTTAVPPELLAALAQAEGAGNPVARTYWRWRLTWDPFAIYRPASSSVGMYQMTDAAFSQARRYCISHHTVLKTAARSPASTAASCRATPSSSPPCLSTARSPRSWPAGHAGQPPPQAGARRPNSSLRPRPGQGSRAAAFRRPRASAAATTMSRRISPRSTQ